MPLYEYQCPECGTFERVQKFSDPILTACPTCERPVEKLLSAPAIQFKGSGWYVTDYAGKGKDADAKDADGKEASAKEASAKDGKGKDSGAEKGTGGSKSEGASKDSSSKSAKEPSSS